MQIYIFRHGVAEVGAPGQPDSERHLTGKGKTKLRKILARARGAGVTPDAILTSPYARAAETARMAKEELGFNGEITETEVLIPSSSAVDVWQQIRTYGDAEQLMLVGHNPLLNGLTCFLTGAPAYGIDLKKGALVLVEVESLSPQPRGTLMWLLTAKIAGA